MRRDLRRYFSTVGWALLLYFALMNFSVLFVQFVEIILALWKQVLHSDSGSAAGVFDGFYQGTWGYFLAAGIGIVILLAWKKTAYWKKVIWEGLKACGYIDEETTEESETPAEAVIRVSLPPPRPDIDGNLI